MEDLKGLTAHDIVLLPQAVAYAQEVRAEKDKAPTQEELKMAIHCSSASAQRLSHFLAANDVAKLADRLAAGHDNAVTRALVQVASDAPYKSNNEYLVREVARLSRKESKSKFTKEAERHIREIEIREEIEALKELAKQEITALRKPSKVAKTTKSSDSGLMLEIAMPDLHVGKLAHSAETGRRPYDVKIAVATFERALEALIERSKGYDISEVLLVVGNDLFHTDNEANTTTGGTPVSTDGRFYKTFWKTRAMMVRAVERLRSVAHVRVLIVPGNHDRQTAFHLGDSLECYFHDDSRVKIENSPMPRKYVEWGNCFLGFCHGDEGKRSDYALLMAAEQSQAWGRTKFREMHVGHLHSLKVEEYHGVRVRVLSALTEADDWHAAQGYIGAVRQAEAFVWSKTEGLIAEVFFNDDAQPPIITSTEIV